MVLSPLRSWSKMVSKFSSAALLPAKLLPMLEMKLPLLSTLQIVKTLEPISCQATS